MSQPTNASISTYKICSGLGNYEKPWGPWVPRVSSLDIFLLLEIIIAPEVDGCDHGI